MSTEIERKIASAPMSVDWCNLPDSPCSLKGYGRCGIKETLRGFYTRSEIRKEAERLYEIAKKDPERYREICEKGLFESDFFR